MCIKLDLIEGNLLFVDGTKIRANASASRTHDKAWYEEQLKNIDHRIESVLDECERIDHQEEDFASLISMGKELAKDHTLKSAIEDVLEEFKETQRKKINQTDPDCANMRSIQGKHASYNVQSVIDDKNGLIVHAEAVNDTSDLNQFARQIEQADELLKGPCEAACADAGYAHTDELEKIDAQGVKVIVPSKRQVEQTGQKPFSKQKFNYDKEHDCYYCPEGHRLRLSSVHKKTGNRYYMITDKQLCFDCPHWGTCTKGKNGRRLVRLDNEEIMEKYEFQYEQEESQKIYAKRKDRVEHPFGHVKRNLKTDAFLMRGLDGVNAETSLLATCFNVVRMITIMGVSGLVKKLSPIIATATT